MMKHKKSIYGENLISNTKLHLIVIIVVSLLLRLYKFRQGEVFVSSDEVYLFEYSLKPVYGIFSGNISEAITQMFRFFNFGWGWGTISFGALNVFLLSILEISINEFTINLPYVFVGTLSVVALYFLCWTITKDKTAAFISSMFLAILPAHVAMSRSIGVTGISSLFLLFLTLICFLRYFITDEEERRKSGKRNLIAGMLLLGMYFGTDNQFPAIILVILCGGMIFCREKKMYGRIINVIGAFLNRYTPLFFIVNIPVIAGTLYLFSKDMLASSYLNLFHSKKISLNFYAVDLIKALYDNAGPVLAAILMISVAYNIYYVISKKEKYEARTFLLLWFIITAFPWLFLVSPKEVWFQIYILQPMVCMIVLCSLMFVDILNATSKESTFLSINPANAIMLSIMLPISFFTLASTSNLVYGSDHLGWEFSPIFGQVGVNTGIKSSGYYARENLPVNSTIFTDAEVFNARYYFGRKFNILGELDVSGEQILRSYDELKKNDDISYIFLEVKNYDLFEKTLSEDNFSKILVFDEEGHEKGALFSKQIENHAKKAYPRMDIRKIDPLFDEKYGTIDQIYIDFG